MDNNNINPEITPSAPENPIELPGATIPDINTIEPINTIEDVPVVAPEATIASPAFGEAPAAVVEPTGNIGQQTAYAAYTPAAPANASSAVDGLAVSSFILGLCSVIMTWSVMGSYISLAAAIVGIILAACAKKKGSTTRFTKAGLTLSIIGLILSLITCVACAACVENMSYYADINGDGLNEFTGSDYEEFEDYLYDYFGNYLTENGYDASELEQYFGE